jgi:hypothetical protein
MTSEDKKHRSHLPIPTPKRTGLITYDAKDPDTKFPPIQQLRPPRGAPVRDHPRAGRAHRAPVAPRIPASNLVRAPTRTDRE